MAEKYSLWSSSWLHDPAQPRTNAPRYQLGHTQVFSSDAHRMAFPQADRIVSENSALIGKVEESSAWDACVVWLGGVSGQRFGMTGNEEAARKAGAPGQPDWDYKKAKNLKALDLSREQGEALGNFNYGATGYENGMNLLTAVGLSEGTADPLLRFVLRIGGGVFQLINDIKEKRLLNPDLHRTAYGEEVKDVAIIEAGMDYGRFLRMSRVAERYGVKLDPRTFGFESGSPTSRPTLLLDKELNFESEVEALKSKVDATLDRLKRERAEEQARERERERERERLQGERARIEEKKRQRDEKSEQPTIDLRKT